MKVTMKDIAQQLGVSINAVSIALNEKEGVSDVLRLKILRTADQMGYVNVHKKYLSVLSKTNICILMQDYYFYCHDEMNTSNLYKSIIESMVKHAGKNGYNAVLQLFNDQHFELPQSALERKISGFIVIGKIHDDNLRQVKQLGIPVVLVDYTSLLNPCDCVLTHNKQGGYMMTMHLLYKGYQKIGFFGDLNYSMSFEDRFIGYRQALMIHHMVDDKSFAQWVQEYCFLGDMEKYVLNDDIDAIEAILRSKPLPEVLFCANDSNAYCVCEALKRMGKSIPDDIGVVGFDDVELCEQMDPQLTSVHIQKDLMGEIAVYYLIEKILKKRTSFITQLLNVTITSRHSIKD